MRTFQEEKQKYLFSIHALDDDGSEVFFIEFPDFPNCFGEGKTINEALEKAHKSLIEEKQDD